MEETIDLRGISPMSYTSGDRIIGCLDELSWVVIRGILIDNEKYKAINVTSEGGHNGRVTKKPYWASIEDYNSKRVMKYKAGSSPHVHWATKKVCSILEDITTNLLGRILKRSKYIIGEINLIKKWWGGKVGSAGTH